MSELDHWEARFSEPGYRFGTAPNLFLTSQAHRLKPVQKALCVADGEGRNGVWLAERGLDVLSVDFSPKALAKAQDLAAARGVTVTIQQADLAAWQWPTAAFDVIVAIFIQFAEPDFRARMFAGIKQALREGGWLLMQNYRPEQLAYATGGPKQVENLYTRALLEEAFGDMAFIEIKEHDSVIREGSGHDGMSALIDLVARK
jgi:SAM-dependent methyltransferase